MADVSRIVREDIDRVLESRALFEPLRERRVLITGITGLVGSMLARALTAANDRYGLSIRVVGQVRSLERAADVLGELVKREDVSLFCGELDSAPLCDYVIHTACPTKSKFFVEHPVETIEASVGSTVRVLEYAKKNGIRKVVYLSSMEQYGVPYEPGQIMTEDKYGVVDHLQVRSCYPESKRMCECYCKAYSHEYGVDVSIARLAQTFGAGAPLTDTRVFMQFARSAINKTDIVLHTEGKSTSNFCYISDVVTAILTILAKGASGEAYNVCHDAETRTIAEIARLVAEKVAGGEIKQVFDIPAERSAYGYAPDVTMQLCSEKLRTLGWRPEVGMEDAYRKLIDYIIEVEN